MTNLGKIIWCLCKVAPAIVVAEDNQGLTPLEYALEAEVDMKIIRKMQDIAVSVRKRNHISKRSSNNNQKKTAPNAA